jgi:hypothetical protein
MSYREEYSFFLRGWIFGRLYICIHPNATNGSWLQLQQHIRIRTVKSIGPQVWTRLTRLLRPLLITDRSEGDRGLGAEDGKHEGSPTVDENHIHPEVCFLPH